MKSLGIDQSLSATALCVLEDGRILHQEVVRAEPRKGFERLSYILDRIKVVIDQHEPDVVQMEDYSIGPGRDVMIKLIELGGLIKWTIYLSGYVEGTDRMAGNSKTFLVVSAQSMKKFTLGKGGAKKDPSYLLNIFDKLQQRFEDDNAADAYMHAWMATLVYQILHDKVPIGNLTAPQQEALISKGVKRSRGLSMTRAMKMTDENKRELVCL